MRALRLCALPILRQNAKHPKPQAIIPLMFVSRAFESVQGIGLESVAVLPNMLANKKGPQLKPCQAIALRASVRPSPMLPATAFTLDGQLRRKVTKSFSALPQASSN